MWEIVSVMKQVLDYVQGYNHYGKQNAMINNELCKDSYPRYGYSED